MTKKGNLFALVKSLSKAEKRYMRLYAGSQGNSSNYLRLFDAIEAQESYDEAALHQKFKGEAFVKQLHVTKIYLSEFILKALRNFDGGTSVYVQLLDLLRDIELLYGRELYDICHYKIQKAEKLASTFEQHALLYDILAWKRKLALTTKMALPEGFNDHIARERSAIDAMGNLNIYWDYTLNMFGYLKAGTSIAETEYVKSEQKAKSMQARILRQHIRYSLFFMDGEMDKAEEAINELIVMLEQEPDHIREDPSAYITAMGNYSGLLLAMKRWEETDALLERIKQAPARFGFSKEKKLTVRLLLRAYNIELEICRDTRQWERGVALAAEAERFIEEHRRNVPEEYLLMLYFQFASVFFRMNAYSRALYWINKILNTPFGDTRPDIQAYARILNLLIHFEQNNIMVLRYATDSTRRFLKKTKMLNAFESVVLKLFSKLSLAETKDYRQIYREVYNQLFAGSKLGAASHKLDYVDIKTWLEEKLY